MENNNLETQDSQLQSLSEAIQGNILFQKETISSIAKSIELLKKECNVDLSNKNIDINNLNYLVKDIKDNFQFTLNIIDEIGIIDELISQINLLALNISIQASKDGDLEQNLFINLANDIREKSDKIQGVIERVFIKEIRNKSFSEHNRYIQNSILPQINDRAQSLRDNIDNIGALSKEFKNIDISLDELHVANSGNKTMLSGITNVYHNPIVESDDSQENKIETAEVIHRPLGKIIRNIKEF